ncbi:MAG: NAD-dependent epimerase/dehydratase family protein [Candidatus Promineifilaceae bacterium]
MTKIKSIRFTPQMFLRIVADALIINVALVTALLLRLVYLFSFQQEQISNGNAVFWSYFNSYRNAGWILTAISLIVFFLSGFYTYGRYYRGRYKALIILQGVSAAFITFGFLAYFLGDVLQLPRGTWLMAWVFSLVLVMVSRLWALLWTKVVSVERRMFEKEQDENKVENVLVIGGAGYIGSALLPKLLDKGYHVRLLDLLLYGMEPIANVMDHPNLEIIEADFRQVDKVVEAMRDIDAVIHLGAIVGDPACALDKDLTIEVNLMATRMIAEVAKGFNVGRFIFASTCSVYGASNEVLDERSQLNPVSLYAQSKIASEKVLTRMATPDFAPTMLRFGTIYGLSGRTRFDLVVNLLTAKALVDDEITVFGGSQWRPFVHVDDAALAVFKVLEAPSALVRNEVFNVGSNGQNYTISQVGELINQVVPSAKIINRGSDTDLRNYRVNFDKIGRVLQFTPEWTVEKGVSQVIEAINQGEVTDYRNAKYSNVKFLNEEGLIHLVRPPKDKWAYDLINDSHMPILQPAPGD